MDENYTYIVRCADGTLYTGWTNDLKKRIKAHNSGKGAKYTKTRRPVELVYFEHFATKEEAMSREYHIKQLKHAQKQALIDEMNKNNKRIFTQNGESKITKMTKRQCENTYFFAILCEKLPKNTWCFY